MTVKLKQRFFDENMKEGVTAARLRYFKLAFPEMKDAVSDAYMQMISEDVQNEISAEAEAIAKMNGPDAIIKKLRGSCNPVNLPKLIEKVLEREDEIIPQLIQMLIRSGNDKFIESVTDIIPNCTTNRAAELIDILPDIRTPYALSCTSLVLGYIGDETVIPTLHDAFCQLKELYPEKDYEQGPLLGMEHIFRQSQNRGK